MLAGIAGCSLLPADQTVYDLVILNGRVMDPASGFDAVRAVGITGGTIRAVSEQPLQGRETLDARGMVVAPGFIDVHQHAHDGPGYQVSVLDGTTTSFELEGGTADIDRWYDARAGTSLVNHGVSVGHSKVRVQVMNDGDKPRPSTQTELAAIIAALDRGFRRGAVAAGMLLADTPAATPWEVIEVFKVAASHGAAVHVHMRSVDEEYYFLETAEIIAASAATGAAAQIVHIQSSGQEDTPRVLELIQGARARGLDITADVYPYTAAMYEISPSASWKSWPESKFQRLEWPPTGERLTRKSYPRFQAIGGNIVDHNNTDEVVTAAVAHPLTMIASDGILQNGVGHPRVAGTFARVLGRYVRDLRALSLMDALRKMTIEPARRMEKRVPAMVTKGRLQVGADADIVLFDPATIVDRATYREPTLPPSGLRDVILNGKIVVRDGAVKSGVFPGRGIRASIR
jgi:dihydroorotase